MPLLDRKGNNQSRKAQVSEGKHRSRENSSLRNKIKTRFSKDAQNAARIKEVFFLFSSSLHRSVAVDLQHPPPQRAVLQKDFWFPEFFPASSISIAMQSIRFLCPPFLTVTIARAPFLWELMPNQSLSELPSPLAFFTWACHVSG